LLAFLYYVSPSVAQSSSHRSCAPPGRSRLNPLCKLLRNPLWLKPGQSPPRYPRRKNSKAQPGKIATCPLVFTPGGGEVLAGSLEERNGFDSFGRDKPLVNTEVKSAMCRRGLPSLVETPGTMAAAPIRFGHQFAVFQYIPRVDSPLRQRQSFPVDYIRPGRYVNIRRLHLRRADGRGTVRTIGSMITVQRIPRRSESFFRSPGGSARSGRERRGFQYGRLYKWGNCTCKSRISCTCWHRRDFLHPLEGGVQGGFSKLFSYRIVVSSPLPERIKVREFSKGQIIILKLSSLLFYSLKNPLS